MKYGKWIRNVKPTDTARQSAVRSLRSRLLTVQHFLPLAANQAGLDVEYVHALRVFTRRAESALRLYEKLLPSRRAAWIRVQLKRIRKAAGNARDCDVLLLRYATDPHMNPRSRLLEIVRQQRCEAQGEIVRVFQDLSVFDDFDRRIRALLKRVKARHRKSAGSERFSSWGKKKLRRVAKKFFAAFPSDPRDLTALHQFRIAGKKLRYDMELLAAAFPARFRKQLYPQVVELQEKLGAINDRVVAQRRLRDWIDSEQAGDEKQHLESLWEQETAALKEGLADFLIWWSPQRIETLRSTFDSFLIPRTAATKVDDENREDCDIKK